MSICVNAQMNYRVKSVYEKSTGFAYPNKAVFTVSSTRVFIILDAYNCMYTVTQNYVAQSTVINGVDYTVKNYDLTTTFAPYGRYEMKFYSSYLKTFATIYNYTNGTTLIYDLI